MKKLSEFVSILMPEAILNFQDANIEDIVWHPKDLKNNALYCVIDNLPSVYQTNSDALLKSIWPNNHINALLVKQRYPHINLPQLVVRDVDKSMAQLAKYYFDAPDELMNIVAVTGTNGKTTTTHLVNQIMTAVGKNSAVLGTLGLYVGCDKKRDLAGLTTPLSTTLFKILSGLSKANIDNLALELSSHGLKLNRAFGLDVDVAVFTNFSRDHLDFHQTLDDYRSSKLSLFTGLKPTAWAVVNIDDALSQKILSVLPCPVITYGVSKYADLSANKITCSVEGIQFKVHYQGKTVEIKTPLIGYFNVYNILAAIGVSLLSNLDWSQIQTACHNLTKVLGRMELIQLSQNRLGIVDYAHTPDSLEKALRTIQGFAPQRIITVFGCGGDRDQGKRPLMGAVAAQLSDICIVTSDNPRREDSLKIIQAILEGISRQDVLIEPDRKKAILQAFNLSQAGDIILIAGKGYETYQIIGDKRIHFDDREILRNGIETANY